MKTGIVFSGGGMKGVAHLGVLQVLQDNNISINGAIGTSVGSIIAASQALGISPKQMLAMIKKTRPKDLYDLPWWLFLLWNIYQYFPKSKTKSLISLPKGLMAGEKLEKWLTNAFTDINMNNIEFPLAITATDINSAEAVVFTSKGFVKAPPSLPNTVFITGASLAAVIRASSAIPGVFAPKTMEARMLIDGGVVNNLPADVLKALGCEKILGIDLGQQENLSKPVFNIFDIAIKSVEIMVNSTSQVTSSAYCDLTLTPKTGPIPLLDMTAIDATFEAGVIAATNALPEIRRIFT